MNKAVLTALSRHEQAITQGVSSQTCKIFKSKKLHAFMFPRDAFLIRQSNWYIGELLCFAKVIFVLLQIKEIKFSSRQNLFTYYT